MKVADKQMNKLIFFLNNFLFLIEKQQKQVCIPNSWPPFILTFLVNLLSSRWVSFKRRLTPGPGNLKRSHSLMLSENPADVGRTKHYCWCRNNASSVCINMWLERSLFRKAMCWFCRHQIEAGESCGWVQEVHGAARVYKFQTCFYF